jgi:hypothetical protein
VDARFVLRIASITPRPASHDARRISAISRASDRAQVVEDRQRLRISTGRADPQQLDNRLLAGSRPSHGSFVSAVAHPQLAAALSLGLGRLELRVDGRQARRAAALPGRPPHLARVEHPMPVSFCCAASAAGQDLAPGAFELRVLRRQ